MKQNAAVGSAKLSPYVNAKSNTSEEPTILAIPLNAKPQSNLTPTFFTAIGKGMPIKNPNGKRKITVQNTHPKFK